MKDAGSALMGIGRASGQNRAAEAARMATSSPLLEINIAGAQGVLFSISGGSDLSLYEVEEAAAIIKETADPEANIIFGTVIDDRMGDDVSITVIATGFDSSRKRDAVRLAAAAPVDVSAGLRAGRENRDYVRDMEQHRAAAPMPVSREEAAAAAAHAQGDPNAPMYQPAQYPPAQDARRPAQEVEDLDIPAFLRRNNSR